MNIDDLVAFVFDINGFVKVDMVIEYVGELVFSKNYDSLIKFIADTNSFLDGKKAFYPKAIRKHNGRYGYILAISPSNDRSIMIICPVHGVFTQITRCHLRGYGCAKCAGNEKLTRETFFIMVRKCKGDEMDNFDYSRVGELDDMNNNSYIEIGCRKCGLWFMQRIRSHYANGCPSCCYSRNTTEQIITKISLYKGAEEFQRVDYSESVFKTVHTPMKMKCRCCQSVFYQSYQYHLTHSCPYCSGYRMTEDIFKVRSDAIFGIGVLSHEYVVYVNAYTPVLLYCTIHKHLFRVTPNSHLSRCQTCPFCGNKCIVCGTPINSGLRCNNCFNHNPMPRRWHEISIGKSLYTRFLKLPKLDQQVIPRHVNKIYRPDILYEYDHYCLIVEVDEREHLHYDGDEQRMRDIRLNLERPCIFIRYNPNHPMSNEDVLYEYISNYMDLSRGDDPWSESGLLVIYLYYTAIKNMEDAVVLRIESPIVSPISSAPAQNTLSSDGEIILGASQLVVKPKFRHGAVKKRPGIFAGRVKKITCGNVEVLNLETFVNMYTPINVKCLRHGVISEIIPYDFSEDYTGCSICDKATFLSKIKNKITALSGDVYDFTHFDVHHKSVKGHLICKCCGKDLHLSCIDILSLNKMCKCREKVYTTDLVIAEVEAKHGKVFRWERTIFESKYKLMTVYCIECRRYFSASLVSLLKRGCVLCHPITYTFEQFITTFLRKFNNILNFEVSESEDKNDYTIGYGCNVNSSHSNGRMSKVRLLSGQGCIECEFEFKLIGIQNYNKQLAEMSQRVNPDLYKERMALLLDEYKEEEINDNVDSTSTVIVNNNCSISADLDVDVEPHESPDAETLATADSIIADILESIQSQEEKINPMIVIRNRMDAQLQELLSGVGVVQSNYIRKLESVKNSLDGELDFRISRCDGERRPMRVWCNITGHGIFTTTYSRLYNEKIGCPYCLKRRWNEDVFSIIVWKKHKGKLLYLSGFSSIDANCDVQCLHCKCVNTSVARNFLDWKYKCCCQRAEKHKVGFNRKDREFRARKK